MATSSAGDIRAALHNEYNKLSLSIKFYRHEFTIYKLSLNSPIPPSVFQLPWFSVTKTDDEISIMIHSPSSSGTKNNKEDDERVVTVATRELEKILGVQQESGWFAMKIGSILDFSLVGILARVVNPLKEVQIPVFVISTFNTDYIFVKKPIEAQIALKDAGHQVEQAENDN